MSGPIRISDNNIASVYRDQLSKTKLSSTDAQKLVAAAKKDDGKVDAAEAADLKAIAKAAAGRLDAPAKDILENASKPNPFLGIGTQLSFTQKPVETAVEQKSYVNKPVMVADATNVVKKPIRVQKEPEVHLPRHELRQGRPITDADRQAYRRYEAERSAQESKNRMMDLDPFAAQVNGNWKNPVTNDWETIGPSPLHVASQMAFGYTVPGQIYNLALVGKSVKETVEDPSAGNIATTTLKVGLTVGGYVAKYNHSPIKHPITATKGLWNAEKESGALHK